MGFFSLQIIAEALKQLCPQRANLILLSASHEGQCHLKEKWFGTQYSVEGNFESWEIPSDAERDDFWHNSGTKWLKF